jgi:hypothetical protein
VWEPEGFGSSSGPRVQVDPAGSFLR